MVSERGFCHQLFSPKDKGKRKVGRRGSGVGFGKGWERVKEGEKRSKWPVHENESKFQSQTSQGRRKRKERAKTTGAQLFSFSSFLLFSFFLFLERVAKHDFYGIVLQSGSVKSSQVKSDKKKSKESKESRAEREREGGRGRQGLSVRVRMFLCVCVRECVCTQGRSGKGGRYAAVCVCVYMFKEALPPPPQVNVGFFARNYLSTSFFF